MRTKLFAGAETPKVPRTFTYSGCVILSETSATPVTVTVTAPRFSTVEDKPYIESFAYSNAVNKLSYAA